MSGSKHGLMVWLALTPAGAVDLNQSEDTLCATHLLRKVTAYYHSASQIPAAFRFFRVRSRHLVLSPSGGVVCGSHPNRVIFECDGQACKQHDLATPTFSMQATSHSRAFGWRLGGGVFLGMNLLSCWVDFLAWKAEHQCTKLKVTGSSPAEVHCFLIPQKLMLGWVWLPYT